MPHAAGLEDDQVLLPVPRLSKLLVLFVLAPQCRRSLELRVALAVAPVVDVAVAVAVAEAGAEVLAGVVVAAVVVAEGTSPDQPVAMEVRKRAH